MNPNCRGAKINNLPDHLIAIKTVFDQIGDDDDDDDDDEDDELFLWYG